MNPFWQNIFRKRPEDESVAAFLGSTPLFAELDPRGLSTLEGRAHSRRYKRNETIFEEGDPGTGIYLVRSGRVRIFSRSGEKNERELASLGPGDFFGENTLLAPAPRTASAHAQENSELIGLFRADLLDILRKHPSLGNKILLGLARVLSERLQTVEKASTCAQQETLTPDESDETETAS